MAGLERPPSYASSLMQSVGEPTGLRLRPPRRQTAASLGAAVSLGSRVSYDTVRILFGMKW